MLILMVTFGQQYDCTAGDLFMGISGLPRVNGAQKELNMRDLDV